MYLYEISNGARNAVAVTSLQEVSGQDAGEDSGQCISTREMYCKHRKMPLEWR